MITQFPVDTTFQDLVDDLESYYGFDIIFDLKVSEDNYLSALVQRANTDRQIIPFVNFIFLINGF